MANYDGYTTIGLTGVLNVGLKTATNATVTDPGSAQDSQTILGDSPNDVFTGPTSLLGSNYTFGGVVYDVNEQAVGFVGSQFNALLNTTVYTTFYPTGFNPAGLQLTVLPTSTVSAGSQWNLSTGAVECFMAGTMIMTARGEIAVEALERGDLVLTSDGVETPVRWIGVSTVARRFANELRVLPIRVRAGALGDGVPSRDLLVSPDHALLLDGHLVHAGALVNGVSILRETDAPEVFKYYHVELETHALIVADGVAAETFVDNVSRMRFDNWAEHEALFGEGALISEMDFPRAKSHRQVPAATRERLQARMRHMLSAQSASAAA